MSNLHHFLDMFQLKKHFYAVRTKHSIRMIASNIKYIVTSDGKVLDREELKDIDSDGIEIYISESDFVKISCRHCDNEWNYTGKSHNATCPQCFKNNNIKGEYAEQGD